MFDAVGWLQAAFSVVCIAFGLTSASRGNRILVPTGIALLSSAVFSLSIGSEAAIPVAIGAFIAMGVAAVWLVRLVRALRSETAGSAPRP